MMTKTLEQQIFENGSKTYYWSSRFFPKHVRADVFRLYSFVRVADDLVDAVPQQEEAFAELVQQWQAASSGSGFDITLKRSDTTNERVVKNMVHLQRHKGIKIEWVQAFLNSMQMDVAGRTYRTLDDSLDYVYGSAEVIGLMMCCLLNIDSAAHYAARMQGRAMQWINFIRDIAEDNQLGRCYFPEDILKTYGLLDLREKTARQLQPEFEHFILDEIRRYESWQAAAHDGHGAIPGRLRVPVMTATDMYDWTAQQIAKDPMVVFRKKVKPNRLRILASALGHMIR